jgi:hypothetical protein
LPRLKRNFGDLTRSGPTIEVRLEPILSVQRILKAEGQEIPFVALLGMIDTGASGTLAQTTAFKEIGVEPYAVVRLFTASTTDPLFRRKFRVRVILAPAMAFEVDAVEGALVGQNVQDLIGRDILEEVSFTYDGPNSRFSISLK